MLNELAEHTHFSHVTRDSTALIEQLRSTCVINRVCSAAGMLVSERADLAVVDSRKAKLNCPLRLVKQQQNYYLLESNENDGALHLQR